MKIIDRPAILSQGLGFKRKDSFREIMYIYTEGKMKKSTTQI